jgi:hypothetical protein
LRRAKCGGINEGQPTTFQSATRGAISTSWLLGHFAASRNPHRGKPKHNLNVKAAITISRLSFVLLMVMGCHAGRRRRAREQHAAESDVNQGEFISLPKATAENSN